jgi:hypothetical protein
MQKTKQTSTKFLVIVITATAILAAVTITTSLGAARPAFAKRNCNEDSTICSGGSGCGAAGCQADTRPSDVPGGGGGRFVLSESGQVITNNGGLGQNVGSSVGGFGFRLACDPSSGCQVSGNGVTGLHTKGPGGNSDSVPPDN